MDRWKVVDNIRKYVLLPLAVGVLGYSLYLSACIMFPLWQSRNSEEYARKNLENRIQLQEEKLGIKHFGVPNLGFNDEYLSATGGTYDAETDSIIIEVNNTKTTYSEFNRWIEKHLEFEAMHVDEVLDHELGHFYMDKLSESLTGTNFPDYAALETELSDSLSQKEADSEQWANYMATKFVSEGVAEYFRYETNPYAEKPDTFCFGDTITEHELVYEIGYWTVKLVIDKHGREGIIYMMNNLPYEFELFCPPCYKERILDDIERTEK